jgi:hypothetical protein
MLPMASSFKGPMFSPEHCSKITALTSSFKVTNQFHTHKNKQIIKIEKHKVLYIKSLGF